MQLILPPYVAYVATESINIEHKGALLKDWSTKAFSKKQIEKIPNMFDFTNRYIADLPESRQDYLFQEYTKIYNLFDASGTETDIDFKISGHISNILQVIPALSVKAWLSQQRDFRLSNELDSSFNEGEAVNYTRDKTYTREDYLDLVVLLFQLRFMIPIWGRHIELSPSRSASTSFKVFSAFQLLEMTSIMREPAIIKLHNYIRISLAARQKDNDMGEIIDGISTEEGPMWELAAILVKKFCLYDFSGMNDTTAVVVRHLHKHMSERGKQPVQSNGKHVMKKLPPDKGSSEGSEEQQSSVFENYKIKAPMSGGDVVYLQYLLENPYRNAKLLDGSTTDAEVMETMKYALATLKKGESSKAQTILLKNTINAILPGKAIDITNKANRALGLCTISAVLWRQGFKILAALATATPVNHVDNARMGAVNSRGRLSPEVTAKLEQSYPFFVKKKAGRPTRPEVEAIDRLVNLFTEKIWLNNLSDTKKTELNPHNPELRRIEIPHAFREEVANWALWLCELSRKNVQEAKPI